MITTPRWRKSTHSGGNEGECVEIPGLKDLIATRDSVVIRAQDFRLSEVAGHIAAGRIVIVTPPPPLSQGRGP